MKAYEAWMSAKIGQKIHRISKSGTEFEKKEVQWVRAYLIDISRVFGVDFSADDWEVVKRKRIFVDEYYITERTVGLRMPIEIPLYTSIKATFEWEE